MADKFTKEELQLAILKVGLDNTALLRIMISNQVKIMDKLGIPVEVPEDIYNDLMPGHGYDPASRTSVFFKAADPISSLLQKRAWEWVHMNQATIDHEEKT